MTHTKKGSKPQGYVNKGGGCIGAFAKKRTHKAERQLNKVKLREDNDLV